MKKCEQLLYIKLLERRLKSASPKDSAKLAKELVKRKDDWING